MFFKKFLHILAKSELGFVCKVLFLVFGLNSLEINPLSGQDLPQIAEMDFGNGRFLPAKSGESGWQRFYLLRRDQWVGLEGAPRTTVFGWNGDIGKITGAGVYFEQDVIGIQNAQSLLVNKSQHVADFLGVSVGLGLGIGMKWHSLNSKSSEVFDPAVKTFAANNVVLLNLGYSIEGLAFSIFGGVMPNLEDRGERKDLIWVQTLDWSPRFLKRKNLTMRVNSKVDASDPQVNSASLLLNKQMDNVGLGVRYRTEGALGFRFAIVNGQWLPGPVEIVYNAELVRPRTQQGPIRFSNEIGIAYKFSKMENVEREGHKTVRYL